MSEMLSDLQLYLFGPPRLELDGKPVKIDTWKAQALLAYLALNNQEHNREALATMFWPDQGEAQARGSLRRAIWTLRQALATDGLDGDKQTLILRRSAALTIDVVQFQTLVAASTAQSTEQIAKLRTATALYRADFLAGFTLPDCPTFDEWQFFTADRLRRQMGDALQRLITWDTDQQAYGTAIEAAKRWLALDVLHEPAHRRLMELYAGSGQPAAALRQYEACKRLLAQELDAPPEPETDQLYAAIRNNRLATPAKRMNETAVTSVVTPSLPPVRYNLPHALTPLFGRTLELAELDLLIFDRGERLITITGPGGMGKTRLALAVAERHLAANRLRDGACFVPLAALDDAQAILPVLVNALGLADEDKQLAADARKRQVLDFLAGKQMLLIFDNFEQVLEGRTLLIEILTVAPTVHLLVTARERLHLRHEQVYPINGLECPTTGADIDAPASAFFLRIAQRIQPHFQLDARECVDLVRICQLVAGMPLALELAAGWVHLLPTSAIAEALQANLDLLATTMPDIPARHQSVRAAFATSWQLLTEEERQHFAQLSVFRGGFNRVAAQQVADAMIGQLSLFVDKSLLEYQRVTDRYEIHELLRQYALEHLTAFGTLMSIQRRHALYFLGLAERADAELRGPEQKMWLDRLENEMDNLRVALATTLQRDSTTALALATALGPFWRRRATAEGWHWLQTALANAPEPSPLRAKALMFAGSLARLNGEQAQARALLGESVAFWRTQADPDNLGQALRHLGWAYYSVDLGQSIVHFEESLALFRQLGNEQRMAQCLIDLAHLTRDAKADYVQAGRYAYEGLGLMRKLGDQLGTAHALMALVELIELQGDYTEAARLLKEAIDLFQLLGNKSGITGGLVTFIENAWHRRAYREAYTWGEQALTLLQGVSGHQMELLLAWHHLGLADLALGEQARAQERLQASLRLANERRNNKMMARCLAGLAGVAANQGDAGRAAHLLGAAYAQFAQLPPFLVPADEDVYQQWIAAARAQLGEVTFTAAWTKGERMTLDQATAYALFIA